MGAGLSSTVVPEQVEIHIHWLFKIVSVAFQFSGRAERAKLRDHMYPPLFPQSTHPPRVGVRVTSEQWGIVERKRAFGYEYLGETSFSSREVSSGCGSLTQI